MPVREATPEDLPALMPLARAYADFYESDPSDEGLEAMLRGAIELPTRDTAFVLAATSDEGEVVGFAACWWKWSSLNGARVVFLDDLFVHPDARGQGLADALIEAIAEIGRAGGAPVVQWLTAHDNHRAQAVYNRVGATSGSYLEYELEI